MEKWKTVDSLKTLIGVLTMRLAIYPTAFAQRPVVRIDEEAFRKMQDYHRMEVLREKARAPMRMTRSDWFQPPKVESSSGKRKTCSFNHEEMKRFADAVDASRGEAGLFHILPLIDQAKKIKDPCDNRKLPAGLWKKPERASMHAVDR